MPNLQCCESGYSILVGFGSDRKKTLDPDLVLMKCRIRIRVSEDSDWILSKNPIKNSNIIPLDWGFSSDLDISFCWRSGADRIFPFSQNRIHFFRIRSISIRILNTANLFSDYHAMINPEPSFLTILISCHQTTQNNDVLT